MYSDSIQDFDGEGSTAFKKKSIDGGTWKPGSSWPAPPTLYRWGNQY